TSRATEGFSQMIRVVAMAAQVSTAPREDAEAPEGAELAEEGLGHREPLRRDELEVGHRLGQGDVRDLVAAQRHHAAETALGDQVRGAAAEAGGQDPVVRVRGAAPLDVAE